MRGQDAQCEDIPQAGPLHSMNEHSKSHHALKCSWGKALLLHVSLLGWRLGMVGVSKTYSEVEREMEHHSSKLSLQTKHIKWFYSLL